MKKIIFMCILIFIANHLQADAITSSAETLKVSPSPKGTALGNSLVADNSFDAIYYNPAGLGFLKDYGFGVNYLILRRPIV